MPRSALLSLGLLAACGVNEKNWGDRYAEALCDFESRCARADFFDGYDDRKECRTEVREAWDDVVDYYRENCEFSRPDAQECLAWLHGSCKDAGTHYDDMAEDCADVWDCQTGWYDI